MQILMLTVLCVMVTLVTSGALFDQTAQADLERFKLRVKLLHELLVQENCPGLMSVQVKRDLLLTEADLSEQQLEVEKKLYQALTEELVLCRKAQVLKSSTTTTEQATTSTTTTTTTTTTTITTIPTPSGPCSSPKTVNLTEAWRKDSAGTRLTPINGQVACESQLGNGVTWFRFSGDGGVQLSDKCRPAYSCGTHVGFWSNASMPVNVGEIRKVPVYGSWGGDCSNSGWRKTSPLTVQRCSNRAGDFVYSVKVLGGCSYAFCGMDL